MTKIISVILVMVLSTVCFGYSSADFNKDGIVNFFDFAILSEQWLEQSELEINPLFEFNSDSDELVIRRNSLAIQESIDCFSDVVANEVRTDSVCVTSPITLSELFDYKPLATDSSRGLVLCTESAEGNDNVQHLYKTSDGVTFTEIVDITSDAPFKQYYDIMTHTISIWSAAVLDDGSWLLQLGNGAPFEGSGDPETLKPSGRLYRSEDAGQTWEMVLNMTYGYVPEWGWGGISGNYITIGEYGYKNHSDPNLNPRKIYLSENYGQDWECIYTLAPACRRHIHQVVFAPASEHTKIYVSTGDPPTSGCSDVKAMYRLDKQEDESWTIGTNVGVLQPCGVITAGDSIYWGCDSRASGGLIYRHWRDDDVEKIEYVLRMPELDVWSEDLPYRYIRNDGNVFSIFYHDGIYYATVSDNVLVGGIYVSKDLTNWVRAYHIDESWGCRIIAGYANGKIWANIRTGTNNMTKGFSFDPVTAKTIDAIRCERGVVNIFNSADDSTFDLTIGQWFLGGDADAEASGWTEEAGLDGNTCCKFVYDKDGTSSRNYAYILSDWFKNLGDNPSNGDIITFTWWMKAGDSWPRVYRVVATWKVGSDTHDKISRDAAEFFKIFPGVWRKYTTVGKIIGEIGPTDEIAVELGISTEGEAKTSDAVIYIDCAQVTYSPDRYYSSSSFQTGSIEREDETVILPLCGVSDAFTATLEWHPEAAHDEFLADIPIATWIGADSSYLSLFWEQSSEEVKLTDGIDTIASTEKTYPFMFADYIRFAVVSDNSGSILYIQDPINGTVTVGDGNDVKLGAEPVLLKLGTDESESDFGCGCFCNIKAWDSKLSFSDIAEVFADID